MTGALLGILSNRIPQNLKPGMGLDVDTCQKQLLLEKQLIL